MKGWALGQSKNWVNGVSLALVDPDGIFVASI